MDAQKYLASLRARKTESKAYQPHQHVGVEIAQILSDKKHVGLYIRLCTQYDPHSLLAIAKDIAEKKNVKNKGAYFMKIYKDTAIQR